jgi:hypothetical protein
MKIFLFLVIVALALSNKASAKNSTTSARKFEFKKETCERLAKVTNNGQKCRYPGCPVFNACVDKNLLTITRKNIEPSASYCSELKVPEVFANYYQNRRAKKEFVQECPSNGCQEFNACRIFLKISTGGKNETKKAKKRQ